MIVRINGVPIEEFNKGKNDLFLSMIDEAQLRKLKPKNLQKLAISLWITSGILLTSEHVNASEFWTDMQPIFATFQQIAMVLGALSIFAGLITMFFKKRMGMNIITTSAMVVGGCFLVPSFIMIVAIIGNMMNDTLTHVFNNLDLKDSVHPGR